MYILWASHVWRTPDTYFTHGVPPQTVNVLHDPLECIDVRICLLPLMAWSRATFLLIVEKKNLTVNYEINLFDVYVYTHKTHVLFLAGENFSNKIYNNYNIIDKLQSLMKMHS